MSLPPLQTFARWFMQAAPAAAPVTPIGQRTATTATGSGSVTLTKPTGTVDGDMVVLVVGAAERSGRILSISWPTGFTQLGLIANDGGPSIGIAWKLAASEGASYAVTLTNSSGTSAGIAQSFTHVNGTAPFDGSMTGTHDTTGVTTHSTPSFTPSVANDCILAAFCNTGGQTYSGYTNSYAEIAEATSAPVIDLSLAFLVTSSTGATSTTATSSGSTTSENVVCALKHA